MTTGRSERLRRLSRVGTGRFVCDQREAGGSLWIISRAGASDWAIREHRPALEQSRLARFLARKPEPAPEVIVGPSELRSWVCNRASELEDGAR